MAAVSSNQTSLEHFSVMLQNNGQNKRLGSTVSLVEVKVYGYTIVISKEQPGAVVVTYIFLNIILVGLQQTTVVVFITNYWVDYFID